METKSLRFQKTKLSIFFVRLQTANFVLAYTLKNINQNGVDKIRKQQQGYIGSRSLRPSRENVGEGLIDHTKMARIEFENAEMILRTSVMALGVIPNLIKICPNREDSLVRLIVPSLVLQPSPAMLNPRLDEWVLFIVFA